MQGRDLDRGKGEGQLVEVRKEEIDPGEQGSTAPVGSNPAAPQWEKTGWWFLGFFVLF